MKRELTPDKIDFLKIALNEGNLTEWETQFIQTIIKYKTITEKQIEVMKQIYKNPRVWKYPNGSK